MTKDEARKAGENLIAYADGRTLDWTSGMERSVNGTTLASATAIRVLANCTIKPESKVVAFDVHTVPRDVWLRRAGSDPKEGAFRITQICYGHIHIGRSQSNKKDQYTYEDALEKFVFADTGEPFGMLEDGG